MHCNPKRIGNSDESEFSLKEASVSNVLADIRRDELNAIMDTPVSYMFDELRREYPDALVVLTTRNGLDWAKSRLVEHPNGPSYICAESAMPQGVQQRTQLALQKPHLPHPFALQSCIARAAARNQKKPAVVKLEDLKKAWMDVKGTTAGVEKAMRILSTSINQFDNYVRQQTPSNQLIEINVRNDDACTIHIFLEKALGKSLPSSWKSKRFGTPIGTHDGRTTACFGGSSKNNTKLPNGMSKSDMEDIINLFQTQRKGEKSNLKLFANFEDKDLDSIKDKDWMEPPNHSSKTHRGGLDPSKSTFD
jgi:hypothetical protein